MDESQVSRATFTIPPISRTTIPLLSGAASDYSGRTTLILGSPWAALEWLHCTGKSTYFGTKFIGRCIHAIRWGFPTGRRLPVGGVRRRTFGARWLLHVIAHRHEGRLGWERHNSDVVGSVKHASHTATSKRDLYMPMPDPIHSISRARQSPIPH